MKLASRIGELRPSAIRAAGKLIASKPGCITFAGGYPASEVMPVEEVVELTDSVGTRLWTHLHAIWSDKR